MGEHDAFFDKVRAVFDRNWLTNNGECVRELERRLCSRLGVKHCIPVCNGTVGLEVAIRALGLTGEVILPSFTFVATAHAVSWLGLTPVFCDVDPETMSLDPDRVQALITPKTSAILGVHVYGFPCAVDGLQRVADQNQLHLFFDAAHAFACSYNGSMIGNFGQCEIFSFHATKFFNTFEGGAISTNDDQLAAVIRKMINFGFDGMDSVVQIGINGKMNEVSAAMGLVNLDHIDRYLAVNEQNFNAYRSGFSEVDGLSLIEPTHKGIHNYQYVVVRVEDEFPMCRCRLMEKLHEENILVRRYFWPGCHRMEPYWSADLDTRDRLPVTESESKRILVFPTGTAVNAAIIEQICRFCRTLRGD